MRKTKIYFAHPFSKMGTEEEAEIITTLQNLGYEVYDPFDGEGELCRRYGVSFYYQKPTFEFAEEIVARDFEAVDKCDALFAWIVSNSSCLGTVRELDRALRYGKKTIVIHHRPNPFLKNVDILYLSVKDFKNNKKYEWQ